MQQDLNKIAVGLIIAVLFYSLFLAVARLNLMLCYLSNNYCHPIFAKNQANIFKPAGISSYVSPLFIFRLRTLYKAFTFLATLNILDNRRWMASNFLVVDREYLNAYSANEIKFTFFLNSNPIFLDPYRLLILNLFCIRRFSS